MTMPQATYQPNKPLKLKDAAELIGVEIGTLYNWRTRGLIEKLKRYELNYILGIREKWVRGKLKPIV